MPDPKLNSRIIAEMNALMHGLHRCGALTSRDMEKFIKHVEEKTEHTKSVDKSGLDKS